jgi:hypothetical protein
MTLDTVARERPLSRATSFMVGVDFILLTFFGGNQEITIKGKTVTVMIYALHIPILL